MSIKRILFISTITITSFSSLTACKKKGCTDPLASNYTIGATEDDGSCETATTTPSANAPSGYTPTYTGTFATLIGIKSISTTSTPIGPINTEIGTAVAVFSNDGGTSYLSAGTVNVEGEELGIQSNNSYVYTPGTSNPTGINFGSAVNWTGTGGAWTSFNASTSVGFSNVSEITSGSVTMANDYTLSAGATISADSVYFAVYGPNGTAIKIVAGGTSSYTFTSAELSAVGSGEGYTQIVGLNYDLQTINGENYYLINETARTKSVSIN